MLSYMSYTLCGHSKVRWATDALKWMLWVIEIVVAICMQVKIHICVILCGHNMAPHIACCLHVYSMHWCVKSVTNTKTACVAGWCSVSVEWTNHPGLVCSTRGMYMLTRPRTYTCMHLRAYTNRTHACTYVHTDIYIHTCMHVHTHQSYTCTCAHTECNNCTDSWLNR